MTPILTTLCGAVLVCSYLKADLTRNDFERFDDLRLSFLFFALFGGLCAAYAGVYSQRRELSRRTIVAAAGLCAALLLASFPVGSKDVFGYAVVGRMWGTYRVNPYLVAPTSIANDPWQVEVSGLLTRPLSAYGPLFLWQAWLINAAAGASFWTAVWLHKLWATAMLCVSLWLADRLLRRTATAGGIPDSWFVALLAWNPLFLFETAGGAHNDIAIVLLLLAALRCRQAQRDHTALALLALSFWYKWYAVIFIPPFLIETWKASGLATAIRRGVWYAAVLVVVGAVLLRSVPGALPTIVGELLHPQKMSGIFPNELSPPLAALFWSLRAAGAFTTDAGFRIFNVSRFLLCAGALVAVVIRQWRAAPSFAALTESCCLTGLAFFFLLITQLWPWHLLTVIALAVITTREPFLLAAVLLTVLALLSNFVTFAVAAVMLVAIPAALWVLRRSRVRPA